MAWKLEYLFILIELWGGGLASWSDQRPVIELRLALIQQQSSLDHLQWVEEIEIVNVVPATIIMHALPLQLPSRPASAQSRLQLKQDFKTASKKVIIWYTCIRFVEIILPQESTHSSPHFIATTASMTIQPRPPQKERYVCQKIEF